MQEYLFSRLPGHVLEHLLMKVSPCCTGNMACVNKELYSSLSTNSLLMHRYDRYRAMDYEYFADMLDENSCAEVLKLRIGDTPNSCKVKNILKKATDGKRTAFLFDVFVKHVLPWIAESRQWIMSMVCQLLVETTLDDGCEEKTLAEFFRCMLKSDILLLECISFSLLKAIEHLAKFHDIERLALVYELFFKHGLLAPQNCTDLLYSIVNQNRNYLHPNESAFRLFIISGNLPIGEYQEIVYRAYRKSDTELVQSLLRVCNFDMNSVYETYVNAAKKGALNCGNHLMYQILCSTTRPMMVL